MIATIPLVADIGLTTLGSFLVIFVQPKECLDGRDWCRKETLNPDPRMLRSNVVYAIQQLIKHPA